MTQSCKPGSTCCATASRSPIFSAWNPGSSN
jgi:hypothetical protein